ncbi:MAG: hypothetical protein OMM_05442 [Candidatus Magnetoglobus multicellularis str. Araruama]|uniref:Cadherin domain-containing protein n=1 Tax=Candidatus Magnetoglobus multicellularis str. Araruama TaxID=890399 RepID=A0A1V1NW95_9BACT|nr:MAG: hypothetical protein OMM_05442 [Candidatus Magnetoglobus multicellularis str. Araruama]
MKIIDISLPYKPEIISTFDFEGYQRIEGIAIRNNIAILSDQYIGLQILDITDPSRPHVIGSLESISWAYDTIIRNNIAYILTGQYLYSVDITNPSSPIIIGSVGKPGDGRNFTIVNDIAYIADYNSGLVSLPVPTEIQSLNVHNETTLSIDLPTPKADGTYILRVFDDNDNYDEVFIQVHPGIQQNLSIEPVENQTTNEDTPISLTFYTQNVETESDNLSITITASCQELIQTVSINSISRYTHTMTITPAENAFGSTEILITISDDVSKDSLSFTLEVLPVNDPPMFSSTTVPDIYEDYGEKIYHLGGLYLSRARQ